VIPILAFAVSIFALLSNRSNSKKNIQLAIQQVIFKTVAEKAKDCNNLWETEPENEKQNPNSPHFKVVSELIITTEVIEKSFELFGNNDESIEIYKSDYYWLCWKQLRTDLRGFVRKAPQIAIGLNPPNAIYTNQIADLHLKFQNHFE
jgi:hypothetical protein